MNAYNVSTTRSHGRSPRVLISGAGIAGPAAALCFGRAGWAPTVVERAPALRAGGHAVDFRGPVHREILERLDLWKPIHERRTTPVPLTLLDATDEAVATLPEVMMAGDVEILRGDLTQLLYDRTRAFTDFRFGERIANIERGPAGAHVTFEGASARDETFDLVVIAEGLRSKLRAQVFGESARLEHHGYRVATFEVPAELVTRGAATLRTAPGRALLLAPAAESARAILVFRGGPLELDERDQARALLQSTFANTSAIVDRVLDALASADDVYLDAIASVRTERYASGRVVLLGDAAWGGTLGGQGTSLAIVGAYVLAGELSGAHDMATALGRYERTMRPYASGCQRGAARVGGFFAPRTRLGIWLRNAMYGALTSPRLVGLFERLVVDAAADFEVPRYRNFEATAAPASAV
ncbi:MAG: FAD-dependent monooxygenase [Polyangiaceae bacterium]